MKDKKDRYKKIANRSLQISVAAVCVFILQVLFDYLFYTKHPPIYFMYLDKVKTASVFFGVPFIIGLLLYIVFRYKANK